MKIVYVIAALLLAPSFATQATAHARTNKSSNLAYLATRATIGSQLQGYAIQGREIEAPPWSFACTTDAGQRECGQHIWSYGSEDALARYGNGP